MCVCVFFFFFSRGVFCATNRARFSHERSVGRSMTPCRAMQATRTPRRKYVFARQSRAVDQLRHASEQRHAACCSFFVLFFARCTDPTTFRLLVVVVVVVVCCCRCRCPLVLPLCFCCPVMCGRLGFDVQSSSRAATASLSLSRCA